MVEKRPALGRGLSALIPDTPAPAASLPSDRPLEIDTDLLRPNKFQPRTQMDDERIEELARSIRSNGIIQPIVVRRVAGEPQGYEIVAGERRWRAAQRAGLLKVPVTVRDIPESRLLAVALIENIQREDLNPIEEAVAYRRLADDFHLTQEQIADAVGKDRSSIANFVRLLRLPLEVRENVASSAISMGHARALLALPDEASQLRVGRDIVAKNLTVRDVEALVRKDTKDTTEAREPKERADPNTRAAEDKLRLALGTRVRINRRGKGGRIEIDFGNEDELQRVYEQIVGE
jgi:ParB family chromosome partitioning protein